MLLVLAASLARAELTPPSANADNPAAASDVTAADAASSDTATDDESILTPPRVPSDGALEDRREVPDYDGREGEWSPSPAVWPARVLLFPLFAVTEFGLRQPIGFATRGIDRHQVATRVREALTFRDHTIGFFPTISIANGMQPGFGISAFADHLFVDWHTMRGSVVTDFQRNIISSVLNRFRLGQAADLNLLAAYQRRNDLVFYGLGPDTTKGDRHRFERRKPFAELELAWGSGQLASAAASSNGVSSGDFATNDPSLQALSHIGGRFGIELSDNNFACTTRTPDICGADSRENTADDAFTLGKNGEAAYFDSGFALMRLKALISLDSRAAGRPGSTGVRLDIFGRYGEGLGKRAGNVRFFRYGGELAGFVDVTGHRRRVIGARLYVELLERPRNRDVPFTELVLLGGPELMRGFLRGRFQGDSATVATIDYRWPIWSFLDANLFYEMGNVWDRHLANFDIQKMRGGYGLALRTNTSRDASFQLLIAAGTKQWSLAPDELRFLAGTNVGF